MKLLRFIGFLLLGLAPSAHAAPPRPFGTDTPAALSQRYSGRPYLLAFWSLDCTHCQKELKILAQHLRAKPDLPLVLVSTDAPGQAAAVETRLAELGLGGVESWIFADEIPDRLRFVIDRHWRGELPRTYLFDAKHQVSASSGVLKEELLASWMTTHLR